MPTPLAGTIETGSVKTDTRVVIDEATVNGTVIVALRAAMLVATTTRDPTDGTEILMMTADEVDETDGTMVLHDRSSVAVPRPLPKKESPHLISQISCRSWSESVG